MGVIIRNGVEYSGGSTIATIESAGSVKPDGTTITIDNDGTIHGAEVDIATSSNVGTVKPDGTSITIDADGTIHSADDTSMVGDEWRSYTTYNIGDYCIHNNKLWRSTVEGSNNEPSEETPYWESTTISDVLKVKADITALGTQATMALDGTTLNITLLN